MLQYIITLLIVMACAVYAIYRIRKAIRAQNDPCAGCKGCALSKELRKQKDCSYKRPKRTVPRNGEDDERKHS